jgi:hypothetical protein
VSGGEAGDECSMKHPLITGFVPSTCGFLSGTELYFALYGMYTGTRTTSVRQAKSLSSKQFSLIQHNYLFIYVLTQQPKGQLSSKREQRDKANTYTQTKDKRGNEYLLTNNHSISAITPTMMWQGKYYIGPYTRIQTHTHINLE